MLRLSSLASIKRLGFQHRHDQGTRGVGVFLDKGVGAAQNLLRVIGPDCLAGGQGKAHLLINGVGAPASLYQVTIRTYY